MVTSYGLWLGNGTVLFSKEKTSKEKSKEKKISGEAYNVNKQTIYTAPKSPNESRTQYSPESVAELPVVLCTRSHRLHRTCIWLENVQLIKPVTPYA